MKTKKVSLRLDYQPVSVHGYRRTLFVHCSDKSEKEAMIYARAMARNPEDTPKLEGYTLTDITVTVWHENE